jgi:hypothetical protein
MSNPIGSVRQAQVPPPSTASPKAPSPEAAPSRPVPADTVRLSGAAMAALQEASDTPAQTAKEAGHGDPQARHLLAKQAAEHENQPQKLHVVA